MFDFNFWHLAVLCSVFAVLAGFAARWIWRGWVEKDPCDRGGLPQLYAVLVALFLFVAIGWPTLTLVPQGGVALGSDGTIFVNTSPTHGRMVWGQAKTFLPRDIGVSGVYTTGGQNARRLVYSVNIHLPSRSLTEVARFEYASGYTLEESVEGLLWQLQEEEAEGFEGFNNPADVGEQQRFSRMIRGWLEPRLPEGVTVGGTFQLKTPVVYYRSG